MGTALVVIAWIAVWLLAGYAASYFIYVNVRQEPGTTDEEAAKFAMVMALFGPCTMGVAVLAVVWEIVYRIWKSGPISKIRKMLYGA